MAHVTWIAVLLFGVFAGCCKGDVVAEAGKATAQLDTAIREGEDAWVAGAAQTQVLKTVLSVVDPAYPGVQEARALESSYEGKLATYNSTLNDLQAQKNELGNILTSYKDGLSAVEKINEYKTAYVGKMSFIDSQLKVAESSLTKIQTFLADTVITPTTAAAFVDVQASVKNALAGVAAGFSSLIELDNKIALYLPGLQQQDVAMAKTFAEWNAEQKTWATQTRVAVDARKEYLKQLEVEVAKKQKDFSVTQAIQAKLDASASDLQQKKTDALALFQELVRVRATLIQDMSDLANTIGTTLGSADKAVDVATQSVDLNAVLEDAQFITNNMMAMGSLQGSFTSSEDVIAQALLSLKSFYSDQELVALQSSIVEQSSWVKNFSSALQAIRDQSAAIRTKLELKRTQLLAATASTANQSTSDYAASVQQVSQIIIQVHNEAASLINDVMTPLVLSISQNMIALMGYFDLQTTTSSQLMSMKNLVDEISNDTAEMDTLLNEFNLWSKTFDQYGDLIQKQVADASLRQSLDKIKQNFASWTPWIAAVAGRQERMKQSVASAQEKYKALAARVANSSVAPVASEASAVGVAPVAAPQTNEVAVTSLSLTTTPSVASALVASVGINSLSLTTTPSAVESVVKSLSLTTTSSVASMSLAVTTSADSVVGAVQAVAELVVNTKKVTDSVAALKAMSGDFKARLDGTKITDDFTPLNTDFTGAQAQIDPLNRLVAQCIASADAAQRIMDEDKAAGRNIDSAAIQSLADQRTILAAAQQDMIIVAKNMSDVAVEFNGLVANFAQKTAALTGVNVAATDLSNKIQTIGGNLSVIKKAIQGAQAALTNAKSGAECDVALAGLSNAQQLKVTIVNAKANEAMPSRLALGKQVISFTQAYGALPAALNATITGQGAWLDALDVSLAGYMDSVASLQAQITILRDSLAQNDVQALAGMTFSAQLQALEGAVPKISQPAHVETIMRNLEYAVKNRYGSLPEDNNPDMVVANKARLLRFIDWIMRNNKFASKISILSDFRQQITV